MNLPEYRAALRIAHGKFEETVRAAAEALVKEIALADQQFFEDQDEAKAEYPQKRQR